MDPKRVEKKYPLEPIRPQTSGALIKGYPEAFVTLFRPQIHFVMQVFFVVLAHSWFGLYTAPN